MKIDVEVELARVKLDCTPCGEFVRVLCPFHVDSTPSCDVRLSSGHFRCHGCNRSGELAELLARLESKPQHVVAEQLRARYGTGEPPVEVEQVERFHRNIWSDQRLLGELYRRGIDDDTIRRRRLGVDRQRITIPITSPTGDFVNIRRYAPGATDGPKMVNLRGRGKVVRIYPFDQLRFQQIVLCGGEIKALAAAQRVNAFDIGAVSLTCGEENWSSALEEFFVGKRVWVCSDIDDAGLRSMEFRCSRLAGVADWCGKLVLPLDIEVYPKGDLNDYVMLEDADLMQLLHDCPAWASEAELKLLEIAAQQDEEPVDLSVVQVQDASHVNRRIRVKVAISAMEQKMYYVPRKVKAKCEKDQDLCSVCPVFGLRDPVFEISKESTSILGIMESRRQSMHDEIRDAIQVPQCKTVQFEVQSNYKVVETRVQKSFDLTQQASDHCMVPAVVVDDEVELNETYEMTGRPVAHPKTQAATIIASKARAIADALSTFDVGDTRDLQVFRPAEWSMEAIDARLDDVYHFYERNITRIYHRKTLHQFVDLTFHSVLSMMVDGRPVKGVMELLVVGDTSQGKSWVTGYVSEYYGLGVKVDCKNATTPGLLGGLENIGGKWFARWGVIPQNDRRLVILEELKGLKPEVFAKLTDMRSSQIAEIPKIQRRLAQARTRLIALSNPQSTYKMSSYSYGVRAIPELIMNPEDVRRFDACVIINEADIAQEMFNVRYPEIAEPFSRETARRLVLWAWTRTADQVTIPPESFEAAVEATRELCETFTDTIPILDRGSARFKVLRLACALAARTFSSDEAGLSVVVLPCHVQWVARLLRAEYSSRSHGYLDYSLYDRRQREMASVADVKKELIATPYPVQLAERMIAAQDIEPQDFGDWCGWSRDEATLFIGLLVRNNALQRSGRAYRKTPAFIQLLREIAQQRPDTTYVEKF